MKNKLLSIMTVLVMLGGGVAMRVSLAQTPSTVQHEDMDGHLGHHMG